MVAAVIIIVVMVAAIQFAGTKITDKMMGRR